MALISILIPAYNSQDFIAETLKSCIDQTYQDIEIVVVDDGSTDRTLEIARGWEEKYGNIHVYTQRNSGACVARNFALEKSNGDYVMFLDADNIISPDKVEIQLNALKRLDDDMAVATCSWDRFRSSIHEATFPKLKVYRDFDCGFELLLELWNNSEMFETACYLLSRKLAVKAGEWVPGLLKNQDGEYFSRVLTIASKVCFCPDAKLYYRSGDYDSVSKDSSKAKIEALLDSFVRYKDTALHHENTARVKTALTRNFSLFMYLYYGKYPDLCYKAKTQVKEMGCSPCPSGTKRTRLVSNIIGLENFLKLRSLLVKR